MRDWGGDGSGERAATAAGQTGMDAPAQHIVALAPQHQPLDVVAEGHKGHRPVQGDDAAGGNLRQERAVRSDGGRAAAPCRCAPYLARWRCQFAATGGTHADRRCGAHKPLASGRWRRPRRPWRSSRAGGDRCRPSGSHLYRNSGHLQALATSLAEFILLLLLLALLLPRSSQTTCTATGWTLISLGAAAARAQKCAPRRLAWHGGRHCRRPALVHRAHSRLQINHAEHGAPAAD